MLSPIRPGTTVQRLLDKRGGAGGYMAIFEVDDLDERLDHLAANDVRVVWAGDLPDIRGRHLHPADVGGTLVSIDQPVPNGSWRWGGPDWQARSEELLADAAVSAIDSVVVSAVDPVAMSSRWTQLGLDRDVTFAPAVPAATASTRCRSWPSTGRVPANARRSVASSSRSSERAAASGTRPPHQSSAVSLHTEVAPEWPTSITVHVAPTPAITEALISTPATTFGETLPSRSRRYGSAATAA